MPPTSSNRPSSSSGGVPPPMPLKVPLTHVLTHPTLKISLLMFIDRSPCLYNLYKALKFVRRNLLLRGTEVRRVLTREVRRGRMADGKVVEEGNGEGEDGASGSGRGLEIRQIGEGREKTISPATLWRIDNALAKSRKLQDQFISLTDGSRTIVPPDTALEIALAKQVNPSLPEFSCLINALVCIRQSYLIAEQLSARAETNFDKESSTDEASLRELWRLLKPDLIMESLLTKQWQQLGFQGKDPATDLRSVGMLGLDCLLHFARTRPTRAREMVTEAVDGGEHWYPLAIASIAVTAYLLDLLKARRLQYVLLSNLTVQVHTKSPKAPPPSNIDPFADPDPEDASPSQPQRPSSSSTLLPSTISSQSTFPSTTSSSSESSPRTNKADPDPTPFYNLHSRILTIFHHLWLRGGYTVMQFEQVFARFRKDVEWLIVRGIVLEEGFEDLVGISIRIDDGLKVDEVETETTDEDTGTESRKSV